MLKTVRVTLMVLTVHGVRRALQLPMVRVGLMGQQLRLLVELELNKFIRILTLWIIYLFSAITRGVYKKISRLLRYCLV